jgi:sporulation protein YlmC with PRC-barrel domain
MLFLTDLIGRAVVDAGGQRVGQLTELAADPNGSFPPVGRIIIRPGFRSQLREFQAAEIAAIEGSAIRLGRRLGEIEPARRAGDELLLSAHVLDAQIVDISGRRLVRVGDVALAPEPRGLLLAGVEIGVAPVLRRLGLRRPASRFRSELISWDELHLASPRGHALQLGAPAARVHRLSIDELADLVERLPPARGAEVLKATSPEKTAATLDRLPSETRDALAGQPSRRRRFLRTRWRHRHGAP